MTSIALTIAGSDSGGGAGIQADLKTFSALGVYGASVITALTAQNTKGVSAIHDAPADFVTAEIDAVFSDLSVNAVKIGMLSRTDIIAAVAAGLQKWKPPFVVLDPVMVATSGDRLIREDASAAIVSELFPRVTLITPNLAEAATLLDRTLATSEAEMQKQGEALLKMGAKAVLMKGGHGSSDESVDLLITSSETKRYAARRVNTKNTHGTGCTLSAAIAAALAKDMSLTDAVAAAKDYVTAALEASSSLHIGHGSGPVHHFHAFWK
jgi:hydroxymethylpyrimidine/phosphomethylpyrimidine kinase